MVPFEYEKKEPSEWFRRDASPGRGIHLYGVSLLEALPLDDYLANGDANNSFCEWKLF